MSASFYGRCRDVQFSQYYLQLQYQYLLNLPEKGSVLYNKRLVLCRTTLLARSHNGESFTFLIHLSEGRGAPGVIPVEF